MLVLTYLISLRYVGIKIRLPIKLRVVSQRRAKRGTNAKHVVHCLLVDDGKRAGMREADRAYVSIRTSLVRIVLGRTEHLGLGREFRVYLKTYGGGVRGSHPAHPAVLLSFQQLGETVGKGFERVVIDDRDRDNLPVPHRGT